MKIKIEIDMTNDAFFENEGCALAAVLRALSERYKELGKLSPEKRKLYDINGNAVGQAEVYEP